MSEEPSNLFFDGLLVGSVLGAVIGTLVAPSSGNETRAKAQKYLSQFFDQPPEVVLEQSVRRIEQGLSDLGKMVEEVKHAAQAKRQEVERSFPSS